ncbi:MAG: hypothetical protein U0736_22605 [Gemmataceae bacterium]
MLLVCLNGSVLGGIAARDRVRTESREVLAERASWALLEWRCSPATERRRTVAEAWSG